ncbi:lipopolysaccharide heptosyltransferase I [Geomesophilobacter sediminis]|uniref:Lipopolysaccharide heptosyltransferase 1 n=1 Tax=Geomesophilobacter sediminis TaxID=2798584 RepID=A0A8J7J090_9BACT|nr:lipopolysaccharide heptosyltransferase I [Geomesophilobacter sediminis]MBJ6725942.1 lipopolysaccharide heptosyltransferase I [Geomesophilobacter sediminis]
MKIAIVRLSSLGDIIFCMASLQVIRRHLPECSITWFADRKFADILDYQKDLERVVKVDLKGLKKSFSFDKLRQEYRQVAECGPFDMVIDMHGMIKAAAIARKVGTRTAGFARDVVKEPLATFLYDKKISIPLEMNTVYRYTSLAAQALGFEFDENELREKEPFIFHGPQDAAASDPFLRSDRKNIIFVVGSTWESRNYPKERLVTIANALRENILICHGSAAELETANYIAEHCEYAKVLPKLSINQLKAAISRADLLIGGDTGPTHIAWANNIPCVVLFGPTPAHRIYPGSKCKILKSSSVVREEKLNKNDFSIRELKEETIIALAQELLRG